MVTRLSLEAMYASDGSGGGEMRRRLGVVTLSSNNFLGNCLTRKCLVQQRQLFEKKNDKAIYRITQYCASRSLMCITENRLFDYVSKSKRIAFHLNYKKILMCSY